MTESAAAASIQVATQSSGQTRLRTQHPELNNATGDRGMWKR